VNYDKIIRKVTRTQKYVLVRLPTDWVPENTRWIAIEKRDNRITIVLLD